MRRLLILPLLAIALVTPAALAQASCKATKVFKGEAPSAIVQQAFAELFDRPIKAVACNDDGTCTQTWGKNCQS
ncbi:MAG: hypothetical protein WBM08_12950 [Prochlorococcaceae cyanobacterium]